MHGVGEWLYLCPAQGCSRGVPGQGFPRHWNLVDHMKRVHNCSPKTHNSDPFTGCTTECNGATPKVSRRKKVPRALKSTRRACTSPSIDPAVVEVQEEMRQLESKSPQLVASPQHTNSPLQTMNDAPTPPPTDQSACDFAEQSFLETHDHNNQPLIQTVSDSVTVAEWLDQNTTIKENLAVPQLVKSLSEAVVSVDIPNAERSMHSNIPRSPKPNAPESDSPPKKQPRCTRSKNGCWTCRRRKIKVGLLLLPSVTAADSSPSPSAMRCNLPVVVAPKASENVGGPKQA